MPMLLGAPMLLGFGAGEPTPIDTFMLQHPRPNSTDVAGFLKAFDPASRPSVAQALLARGVESRTIAAALNWLETSGKFSAHWPKIAGVLALVSASASAYHGYRRNQSIGWAVWWFLMGSLFPVVTPVIGIAQGFGKRKAA